MQSQLVNFVLPQDGSGYPPATHERIWGRPLKNGNFQIDNIPFYVIGISSSDEVEVAIVADELFFNRLVVPSGNSTFRLFLTNVQDCTKIRHDLSGLGCASEFNQLVGVVAVEVPANGAIHPFLNYITLGQQNGVLDIEEGALRHAL